MARSLKKSPQRQPQQQGRHPQEISDLRSRPNAVDYRDNVSFQEDLQIGDAGAGYRRHRTMSIFSKLFDGGLAAPPPIPFDKTYTVVMDPPLGRPLDYCRYYLYSVRFYGCSKIQMEDEGDTYFLPDRNSTCACESDTVDQVPTPLKGWIRTDDGMFRVFDILGDRTVEVYALHLTAGILAPANSYDVFTREREDKAPAAGVEGAFNGVVDQSCVGVSITSIITTATQTNDQYTRCVSIPVGAGPSSTIIPVNPGSRAVRISTPSAAAALVGFTAAFSWVPPSATLLGGDASAGNVDFTGEIIAQGQTRQLAIPGTPYLRFGNTSGNPIPICITFLKEL